MCMITVNNIVGQRVAALIMKQFSSHIGLLYHMSTHYHYQLKDSKSHVYSRTKVVIMISIISSCFAIFLLMSLIDDDVLGFYYVAIDSFSN
mmetsp:Transcript_7275/g.17733  ORF Transcript_7275/g.17733 Transcript_7275/m.17733 type:complete len:91 (-) Transcript_7275:1107-1379(-)